MYQPVAELHQWALVMRIGKMRHEDAEAAEQNDANEGRIEEGQTAPLEKTMKKGPRSFTDHADYGQVEDIDAERNAPEILRNFPGAKP